MVPLTLPRRRAGPCRAPVLRTLLAAALTWATPKAALAQAAESPIAVQLRQRAWAAEAARVGAQVDVGIVSSSVNTDTCYAASGTEPRAVCSRAFEFGEAFHALLIVPRLSLPLAGDPDAMRSFWGIQVEVETPLGLGLPAWDSEFETQTRGGDGGTPRAQVLVGNPQVDLRGFGKLGPVLLTAGLTLAAPVVDADAAGRVEGATALTLAIGRGGGETSRWAAGFLPTGGHLSLEVLLPQSRFALEVAPVLMVPVLERAGDGEPQVVVPVYGAVAGRTTWSTVRFQGGLGGQVAYWTMSHLADLAPRNAPFGAGHAAGAEDNLQLSLEPFAGVETARSSYRLGVLVPLDAPLGLGTEEGRTFSVTFTMSYPF